MIEGISKDRGSASSNKGSPGVDGMTIDAAKDYLREHWPNIRAQLLEGSISRSRSSTSNLAVAKDGPAARATSDDFGRLRRRRHLRLRPVEIRVM